jgi:hypothetical protein
MIVGLSLAFAVATTALAEQSILKAYAPSEGDGTSVILVIDWPQAKRHAAAAEWVMLRRRADGPPVVPDTLATLPADSARFVDTGLDPGKKYHYFAYFKSADSATTQFGSSPAVVHLGPIPTRPKH